MRHCIRIMSIVFFFFICFTTLAGCKKPGRGYDCHEVREKLQYYGEISTRRANRVYDVRGYYLSHQDDASVHKYDNDTLTVWGYRYVDFDNPGYIDTSHNDTAWMIWVTMMPLRNVSYGSNKIDEVWSGSRRIAYGRNYVSSEGGVRAVLKGDDIALAKAHPDDILLMRCKVDVVLRCKEDGPTMCSYTDAVVTLHVIDLKIPIQ